MVDDFILSEAYKQIEQIVNEHSNYDRDILLAAIVLAIMVDESARNNLSAR